MLEHSLLGEPLLRVTLGPGLAVTPLSLPQVLARLSAGEALGFSALRPHQQAPWHAFLVQLAYLALDLADDLRPPLTPNGWVDLLRGLTPGFEDDGPWCLINAHWQAPAFLQSPCSAGRESDYRRSADAAQDIDVLVTARHHDEKSGKLPLDDHALDTLVYALVALQGWSAFLGAGNYNTMRMNGGFSSRPQFRLAYARGSGPEFLRDLHVLLDDRDRLARRFREAYGADATAEHRLLWLPVWDEGSLSLGEVHPYALEVCRRVRLVREQGCLRLRRAGSSAMRVAAKDQRGNVMDPWVPIMKGDAPKALTAQAHSLGYRKLQELIFDRAPGLFGAATWLAIRVGLSAVLVVGALLTAWQLQGAIASAALERMALHVQRVVLGDAPAPAIDAPAVVKRAVVGLFPSVRRLTLWALSSLAAMTRRSAATPASVRSLSILSGRSRA